MTAMASALGRAGFNIAQARLRNLAHEAMIKHHHNIERALPTLRSAIADDQELIDEALRAYLHNIEPVIVNSGPGHLAFDNPFRTAGSPLTNRGGAGHKLPGAHSERVRPVREPSASQRAAAASVAKTVALSVFDTFKLPSGDAPARTPFHRLERLGREHNRGAALIRLIQEMVPNPDPQKTPADYLSERQYQRLIQKAAEVADAA